MKYALIIVITELIFMRIELNIMLYLAWKRILKKANVFVSNVEVIKYSKFNILNHFMNNIYSLKFSSAKIGNKTVVFRYQLPIFLIKI